MPEQDAAAAAVAPELAACRPRQLSKGGAAAAGRRRPRARTLESMVTGREAQGTWAADAATAVPDGGGHSTEAKPLSLEPERHDANTARLPTITSPKPPDPELRALLASCSLEDYIGRFEREHVTGCYGLSHYCARYGLSHSLAHSAHDLATCSSHATTLAIGGGAAAAFSLRCMSQPSPASPSDLSRRDDNNNSKSECRHDEETIRVQHSAKVHTVACVWHA